MLLVIPANAGIPLNLWRLRKKRDPRLRGGDGSHIATFSAGPSTGSG